MEELKNLIEQYESRLRAVIDSIDANKKNDTTFIRLMAKKSCYQVILVELGRLQDELLKQLTDIRQMALKRFKETGLEETPLIWHVWKRAFDSGYNLCESYKVEELRKEIERLNNIIKSDSEWANDGEIGDIY